MKRLSLLVVSLVLWGGLQAQTSNTVIDRIIRQVKLFPQEKTYVHTDATDYLPGERVWMRAYVVNALSHEPVTDSRYVYVELMAPDGLMLKRVKLVSVDGVFSGYVDIPAKAVGGAYRLRSYTRLMTGLPGFEDVKDIFVAGRQLHADKRQAEPKADAPAPARCSSPLLHTEWRGDSLHVVVGTMAAGTGEYYMLAHSRACPFFLAKVCAQQTLAWHRDSLPQGLFSLLLTDLQLQVVDERLLLSDNQREQCRLDVKPLQTVCHPLEPVSLQLDIPYLADGERADVSVSVAQLAQHRHQPSSIVAHLMLSSEVQGGVERPEFLCAHRAAADSLLCGRVWQRYDFGRLLKGDYTTPQVTAETTQTISGRVQGPFLRRAVADAPVSLISPQTGLAAVTRTDADGRFQFPGMDYPEGTQYVLMATRKKGGQLVRLTVDEPDYPAPVAPHAHKLAEPEEPVVLQNDSPLLVDGMLLEEIEVTGTRRNSASEGNVYAQMADASFGLAMIEQIGATCLHELLRRIPSVIIRDNQAYIRGATSIYADNPAVFAIDGVIMEGDYDLDNIPMQDVARVDVFKTGSTVIWGARGGSGVISITTKEGHYESAPAEKMNQQKMAPLGYQRPVRFAAQQGLGRTLYWCPSASGPTVRFTAPAWTGECRVVVEGVTSAGRLIHEEQTIQIGPHSNH